MRGWTPSTWMLWSAGFVAAVVFASSNAIAVSALLVLAVLGFAYFSWAQTPAAASLAVLLTCLPLFFDLRKMRLMLLNLPTASGQQAAESGTRIHLAFLAWCVLFLVVLVKPVDRRVALADQRIVVGLLAVFTAALGYGLVKGSGITSVVFYGQTILPLLVWITAGRAGLQPHVVAKRIMTGVTATAAGALLFQVMRGGLGRAFYSSIALESVIPQYRSYFPALQAVAVAIAVGYLKKYPRLAIATLVVTALTIPFMWSRGGIVMIGIAAAAGYLFAPGSVLGRDRVLKLAVATGIGAALVIAMLSVGAVGQRSKLSDLAGSDGLRGSLAGEAAQRILGSPIFGDAFRPYSETLAGGRAATFARLFPTHNQYLDYGIRAGLLAVLALVALLTLSWLRSWRALRSGYGDGAFHGATLAMLLAVGLGALGELYITQTWTGSVFMVVLGTAAREVVSGGRPRRRADGRWTG